MAAHTASGPAPAEPVRRSLGEGGPPADCTVQYLGVAFFDLSRIPQWSGSEQDAGVARFFQRLYALADELLAPAGARIVKLMGDAGLVVFERRCAEAAIAALCELSARARALAVSAGLDAYCNVNVHFGPVVAGPFGPPGAQRFDVIGKTVNVAARLGRRGVTLSPQAFRCLSAEARGRFEKIAPPITYRFRG
jgi:class 3 adenylate cyclase